MGDISKDAIQIEVNLDGLSRKKDRSVTLRFTSMRELTHDEFSELDKRYQDCGWLLFKPNEFVNEDIPKEDVETDVAKSQSTQIRDALWVLYKAKGGNGEDKEAWNMFYRKQCQAYKTRILNEVHAIEEGI